MTLPVPPAFANITPPWESQQSIYDAIYEKLKSNVEGFSEDNSFLPDEARQPKGEFPFVAGALDGIMVINFGSAPEGDVVTVYHALLQAVQNINNETIRHLYNVLTTYGVSGYLDDLYNKMRDNSENFRSGALYQIAFWLVAHAPDREPVKLGISLMALYDLEQNYQILGALGQHEEFTLYVIRALVNQSRELEAFELAKKVHGWGRIFAIQLLAATTNEEIKKWMVYGGYENTISLSYTAYCCVANDYLLQSLQKANINSELLKHANVLISALIEHYEGPMSETVDGLLDYTNGPNLLRVYMQQAVRFPNNCDCATNISYIHSFLERLSDGVYSYDESLWTPEIINNLKNKGI